MRVTPPFLVRTIQGGLRRTQYAKGRYAVRKNPVLSYADINFYFKKVQFSLRIINKRDIQSQITLNFSRARFARVFGVHFSIYKLKQ